MGCSHAGIIQGLQGAGYHRAFTDRRGIPKGKQDDYFSVFFKFAHEEFWPNWVFQKRMPVCDSFLIHR